MKHFRAKSSLNDHKHHSEFKWWSEKKHIKLWSRDKKSKTSPLTLYFFVSCSVREKHSSLVMYNWAASAFNYKWLCPFERANESPLTQHIPNGFADLSVRPWARPPGARQTVRNRCVNISFFQWQGKKWMFLDNSRVMSSGSSSCGDELLFKVAF